MISAICFINTELGEEIRVRSEISMYQGVKKIIELFGEHDFLILIKADDLRQVDFIIDSIRKTEGVKFTKTFIEAEY